MPGQTASELGRAGTAAKPRAREAGLATSVLALQSAAGNRAVAWLLGGPEAADKRFMVQENLAALDPDRLGTGAEPLGETLSEYAQWSVPEFRLIEDAEQVEIASAGAAAKPESRYFIPKVGEYDLGGGWGASGGNLTKDEITFKGLNPAPPANPREGWQVSYCITAKEQQGVRKGELQHVADFQRAFDLSCGLVANALTAIKSRRFSSSKAAMQAFGTELRRLGDAEDVNDAPEYLAPADPYGSWLKRIGHVADRLESTSFWGRDWSKNHSAKGFRTSADGNRLRITPNVEVDDLAPIGVVDYDNPNARRAGLEKEYAGDLFAPPP